MDQPVYLSSIFEPISRNGGIVNRIIGDGLMALFGIARTGEDHRQQAVNSALDMLEELKTFNAGRAAAGADPIRIGIGIASGSVIAGYAGTRHRATYTCVGDTVNLAARIESHTKVAGRPILIDAYTREGLSDGIAVEALGLVTFKGKSIPINIFSVETG